MEYKVVFTDLLQVQYLTQLQFLISFTIMRNACFGFAIKGLIYMLSVCVFARLIINKVHKTIVTVKGKPLLLPRADICFHIIYGNVYFFLSMPAVVQSNVHTVGYGKQGLWWGDCTLKASCVNSFIYRVETEMAGM